MSAVTSIGPMPVHRAAGSALQGPAFVTAVAEFFLGLVVTLLGDEIRCMRISYWLSTAVAFTAVAYAGVVLMLGTHGALHVAFVIGAAVSAASLSALAWGNLRAARSAHC